MNRYAASKIARNALDQYGLTDWSVRILTDNKYAGVSGLCIYKDKTIVLNGHHVDIHPEELVTDTILHEVAHALMPGHGHNETWQKKAIEIGCKDASPCASYGMPDHIIDAIRSGNMVECVIEETVTVTKTPKYKISKIEEKCPYCGKVAVEKLRKEAFDREGNKEIWITLKCFHVIVKKIPKGTPFETMVSNDWKPEISKCKHDWPSKEYAKEHDIPPNQCLKCGEYKLLPFQIEGAKFLEFGLSTQKGIGLFDDMGLGKTVQSLAHVRFHPDYSTPTVYVVKSNIKFQWFKEIVRWLSPAFGAQVINTSKDPILPGLKSYIISFDLLKRYPIEKLIKVNPKLAVIDECQQIKNPDSTRTAAVRILLQIPTIKVIMSSGTPWKNRGSEFFPALNAIAPQKFPSHKKFKEDWVTYYFDGKYTKEGGIANIEKFKEYTKDIMIRREFDEVMEDAPVTNRMRLNIQLDQFSQEQYDESEGDFIDWFNEQVLGGESLNGLEVLAKMAKMRHITGLAKIPATVEFVEEFIESTDKKITVFHHHIDVGSSLVGEFKKRYEDKNSPDFIESVPIFQLHAKMSDEEKFNIAEEFQRTPRGILVAGTLGFGEGVNLQTCSNVVFHERQWNPQNEDQAAPGRFKRIGQKARKIDITFPQGDGTIDQIFDGIVESKRRFFHSAMNKGELQQWDVAGIGIEMAEMIVKRYKGKRKAS